MVYCVVYIETVIIYNFIGFGIHLVVTSTLVPTSEVDLTVLILMSKFGKECLQFQWTVEERFW